MKATIDNDGRLTIHPENETESYALRRWFELYRHDKCRESESVLAIAEYWPGKE